MDKKQLEEKLNADLFNESLHGDTKAKRTSCCLFFFPLAWPFLIIASPILWLMHAMEKRAKIGRIKKDYEKNLENLKTEVKTAPIIVNKKKRKRNFYYPFSTKEEYLEHLAEKERKLRKQEETARLAKSFEQRNEIKDFKGKLKKVDDLIELSPIDFEKWVKSEIFESDGWKVEETKVTGDGGIDLVIVKKDERSVAQCKRFRSTVGEPMIRDFYGAMMHEGVSRGFFITTGLYSLSALKFAEDKPIEMIDRRVLASKYL